MNRPTCDTIADEVSGLSQELTTLLEDLITFPSHAFTRRRKVSRDVGRRVWDEVRGPIVNLTCRQVRDPIAFHIVDLSRGRKDAK